MHSVRIILFNCVFGARIFDIIGSEANTGTASVNTGIAVLTPVLAVLTLVHWCQHWLAVCALTTMLQVKRKQLLHHQRELTATQHIHLHFSGFRIQPVIRRYCISYCTRIFAGRRVLQCNVKVVYCFNNHGDRDLLSFAARSQLELV